MLDKIKKNYIWFVFILVTGIFITLSVNVWIKSSFNFDNNIFSFLVEKRNPILNLLFTSVTQLGSATCLILIALASVIFVKDKTYKILIPINLTFIGTINSILKQIFKRNRPNQFRLMQEEGYSFPSGHAMASTAFYGLFIYIIYKKIDNKRIRNSLCFIFALLILFIDISRIYIGVHYTSDVIAGTCFSIAYLIIILKMVKLKSK